MEAPEHGGSSPADVLLDGRTSHGDGPMTATTFCVLPEGIAGEKTEICKPSEAETQRGDSSRMLPPAVSPVDSGEVLVSEERGNSSVVDTKVSMQQTEVFSVSEKTQEQSSGKISEALDGGFRQEVSDQKEISNQGEPKVISEKVKKSWVQVAQKHTFTKQKFVVDTVDGRERVTVPKEVFVNAKPLWEDFVIGNFLSTKAPHVGKIHMIVNKIWRLGDRTTLIDVFEVNETTVKFRIRNEAMRRRVLNRGMWNIMDIPMVVSKWTPYAEEAQPAMKSIQIWVTLKDVPLSMFTDKGLEFLSSAVGRPKRLHPKTEACVSFEEAQILVEADLTKELPREYVFTGEEEGELDAVVKYSYPWLPPRCSCCQKWGHSQESCLAATSKPVQTAQSESISPVVETEHVVSQKNHTTEAGEKDSSGVPVSLEKEKTEQIPLVRDNGDTKGDDQGWISTPKHSRSPGKKQKELKFGEVSILSNTYSVLSGQEELEKDKTNKEDGGDEKECLPQTLDPNGESTSMIDTEAAVCKKELPLRQSLPRGSKTAHKAVSAQTTQSSRFIPKDQSKRTSQKHH